MILFILSVPGYWGEIVLATGSCKWSLWRNEGLSGGGPEIDWSRVKSAVSADRLVFSDNHSMHVIPTAHRQLVWVKTWRF